MRNLPLCLVVACMAASFWGSAGAATSQASGVGQPRATGYAAGWRDVVDHGDQDALFRTYAFATRMYRQHWSVTAADCEQNATQLQDAVRLNPMSFALRSLDADCAAAMGDAVLASKRRSVLLGLMQQAVDELPPDNIAFEQYAIPVLSEIDAYAFARASGEKVLFAHYDMGTWFGYLPLALDLWDPSLFRARTLWFDWFDNLLVLQHSVDTRFPDYRANSARTLLQAFATPGSSAEAAHDLLSAGDLGAPASFAKHQSLAAGGNYPAMVDVAKICLSRPGSDCAESAVKLLQPWLQQKNDWAALEMACAYAGGLGVKRNEAAARSLIAEVDKRRRDRSGTLEFATRRMPANKGRIDAIVRADVLVLADGGDPLAETMVATEVQIERDDYRFDGPVLEGLKHAAESGLPTARFYLGHYFLDEGQDTAGVAWLEKAALAGNWKAQSDLGDIYRDATNGQAKDFDRGTHWSELAQQVEVDPLEMALIGGTYLEDGPSTAANKHLAERWLQNAAAGADRYGSAWLAHLYEEGGPGVTGGEPEAIKLYRWLASTSATDAESRWYLARLLGKQPDASRHSEEIKRLLKEAAKNGDGESQDLLASALLSGRYGPAEPTEAARWYQLAIGNGDVDAGAFYGHMLANGIGVPRDPEAAFKLWRKAIAQGNEKATNGMAWTLCTFREFAATRSTEGLQLALAFKQLENPVRLDTLAACYAATGDFVQAISNQERAVMFLDRQHAAKADRDEYEKRLALYRRRVAYVSPDPAAYKQASQK